MPARSAGRGFDTKKAPDALRCVSTEEAARAQKFYFMRDAKLSLGSSLLKRLFANKVLGIPWAEARFGRAGDPVHGKPICIPAFSPPEERTATRLADFNVAHQAGLVVLIGSQPLRPEREHRLSAQASLLEARDPHKLPRQIEVGVDVVCTDERSHKPDQLRTAADVDAWIDIYADAFSDADMQAMKAALPLPNTPGARGVQAKLRRFYAYWALKEAYVKLVGEGLLANWLRQVVFEHVRVPEPAPQTHTPPGRSGRRFGQPVTGIRVVLDGHRVPNVQLALYAFEDNYMFATAVRWPADAPEPALPHFRILDVDKDIIKFGIMQ